MRFGMEPAPSLRWRGNEKQQFHAARSRARRRGHFTSSDFIKYGPPGTTDRYVFRCSCGESSRHASDAERIVADRAHNLRHGARR